MFFVLSKILFFVLAPFNAAIFLLTGAMWAMHQKRFKLARQLGLASWLVLVAFGVLPTGRALTAWLEARTPYLTEFPARVDGVILLGGFIDTELGFDRGTPQVDGAQDRLTEFVDIAREFPNARLIFASGQGSLAQKGTPEGQMIQTLLDRQRVYTRSRLKIDDKSRTTYENAVNAKAIANPREGENWLLVTSAWHMPRAVGAFNSIGWKVTPMPTDYQTNGKVGLLPDYRGFLGNMALSQTAIHELGGIVVYALSGKWKLSLPVETKEK